MRVGAEPPLRRMAIAQQRDGFGSHLGLSGQYGPAFFRCAQVVYAVARLIDQGA